ncbi:bifunctional folylpolyglutamate synthase/dihydrofolate synthase [Enhygromyxa salina]|uniref:Dihydrofolate synthase/folylpolyglutamate synthase n=1 Tax=Enhygromyxa salina TaxID=215803 RepID=A0A2S9YQD4_9BACT|nr:bifunctional folylpolyglutamate synthase/dihydrofolate synthase [Enhygromyxa salina]PRQ07303.1 Folylpolyglutamate synthase [Enhygromyxa salina]
MSVDWRVALFARRTIGVRLGLDAIERVLDALLPGLRERPPFTVVQIVGTNGKGSTAAMLDHGLRQLGPGLGHEQGRGPVGLFTSPHLERIGERIRVDGQAIADEQVQAGVDRLAAVEATLGVALTFFEVLTAIALLRFVDAGCKVVVLEAGLGGRLDATSAVRADVVGFARFGLDHQAYLGDTLEQIAAEKAAVIRRALPVFSVEQPTAARLAIEDRAREFGAALSFVTPLAAPPVGLRGPHQRHNGALALALLGQLVPAATLAHLDGVRWAGRLEQVGVGDGELWLDVAHNLDGVEALCAALRGLLIWPDAIVFGTMADKPAPAMAAMLRELGPLWLVPPAGEGAYDLGGFAEPGEPRYSSAGDRALLDAMRRRLAAGARLVVCGSHFLVGVIRAQLAPSTAAGGVCLDGPELSDPVSRR